MIKKALITGITGQDGSYLAEILLEKGYEVYGMVRHSANPNYWRIQHLLDKIQLVNGDLADQSSLTYNILKIKPDEVYNLAAQSYVGLSWEQPIFTVDVTGMAVLRLLEAIRQLDKPVNLYQASSSEMFGKVREMPQKETTPFYPRSPYGVSKCFGHNIVVNYRESYNMFNVSGILFNHECLSPKNTVIVRNNGIVDIVHIDDIRKGRTSKASHAFSATETFDISKDGVEILTSQGFKPLLTLTKRYLNTTSSKSLLKVETRSGNIIVTNHHNCLDSSYNKIRADELKVGDFLLSTSLKYEPTMSCNNDFAELLGYLVAEGHISKSCITAKVSGEDLNLLKRAEILWTGIFGGRCTYGSGISGFSNKRIPYVALHGVDTSVYSYLRALIYHPVTSKKRVPINILNSNKESVISFLKAYNLGDGLKADKCKYEFKSFKTNSRLLAHGLICLIENHLDQVYTFNSFIQNETEYFQINLNSPRKIKSHLVKPKNQIKKIISNLEDEFVYDLETEVGDVQVGPGNIVVSNSPRRGTEFVTRKISQAVGRIVHGLQKELFLGTLDSKRDWGYAKDYMEAAYLMMQHSTPEDFVIATGETHSVREFCQIAFSHVGLNYEDYVKVDPQFVRPAEVDILLGDYSKAKSVLGWEPKTTFKELVIKMVEYDTEQAWLEKK